MDFIKNQNPNDAVTYSLSTHGTGFKLASNFTLLEMASKDGADEMLVHPALILLLQHVRNHFGEVVNINSGYRSPAHNKAIGGAKKSRHKMGMATDITVFNHTPSEVWKYLKSLNPGGLGRYNSFTHVDIEGEDRRWDNR